MSIGGTENPGALEGREAGFYEVRPSGKPNERARIVAVNVATPEMEFATFDPLRLTTALGPTGAAANAESAAAIDPAAAIAEHEREQSLWWYIVVAVALLLLAETILARRVTLRRTQLS